MPKVIMSGHNYYYPILDVLKLFYGKVQIIGDDKENPEGLIAGDSSFPLITSNLKGGVVSTTFHLIDNQISIPQMDILLPIKREIKRQIYEALCEITGFSFPWGSLTGIRPTLVAAECNFSSDYLEKVYHVSPQKAQIAVRTSSKEIEILKRVPNDSVFLYISVPICESKCVYCSFPTALYNSVEKHVGGYIEALIAEIDALSLIISRPISGIYIGGGTPTGLPENLFAKLMTAVKGVYDRTPGVEFTVEAGRADSINASKLEIMRDAGVNRICINPQTFNDKTLECIGRNHTANDVIDIFKLVHDYGFCSINMDLIAGLPGETVEDFANSLNTVLSLSPENITIHSLSIKRSSRLHETFALEHDEDELINFNKSNELVSGMLMYSYNNLGHNGYQPYYLYRQKDTIGGNENIGYSQDGYECLYNVIMMSDSHNVYAAGAKAISKRIKDNALRNECGRLGNPSDIKIYIERIKSIINSKKEFFDGI